MKSLWKLLFRGRLKRLRGVEQAAALMAAGRLDEATRWLERFKPRSFLEDVSVYHFVAGRLAMEKGELDEAEAHLWTARTLGIQTPALGLLLSVLMGRKRAPERARCMLEQLAGTKDGQMSEQVAALKTAVDAIFDGSALRELRKEAHAFARDALKTAVPQDKAAKALAGPLTQHLKAFDGGGNLDERTRAGATALFGEILVQCARGAWQLGLEIQDHAVVVAGVSLFPSVLVDDLVSGRISGLVEVVEDPLKYAGVPLNPAQAGEGSCSSR